MTLMDRTTVPHAQSTTALYTEPDAKRDQHSAIVVDRWPHLARSLSSPCVVITFCDRLRDVAIATNFGAYMRK